jgi:hypothetical protein
MERKGRTSTLKKLSCEEVRPVQPVKWKLRSNAQLLEMFHQRLSKLAPSTVPSAPKLIPGEANLARFGGAVMSICRNCKYKKFRALPRFCSFELHCLRWRALFPNWENLTLSSSSSSWDRPSKSIISFLALPTARIISSSLICRARPSRF